MAVGSGSGPDGEEMRPVLDAHDVERMIRSGLPLADHNDLRVLSVSPGTARVGLAYRPWMLRPGGSIAGPVLMLLADAAMYAVLLAHGGEPMALTSDLSIRFLGRARPADLTAEARLLRLGRRLAVIEVAVRNAGADELAAHVTGTYVRPLA